MKVIAVCLVIVSLTTMTMSLVMFINGSSLQIALSPPIDLTFHEFLEAPNYPRINYGQLSFMYEPVNFCKPSYSTIDVLFIVHSAVHHFDRRQVLRDTIGQYIGNSRPLKYKLLFVVGTPTYSKIDMMSLIKERRDHNDILIVDMADMYQHMTFKAVAWLKWIVKNCLNINFVFKMDDDALVNVPILDKFIWSCYNLIDENSCSRISCRAKYNEPVMRYIRDKNQLKYSEYPFEEFPVMCPGLAMIIPSILLRPLLDATTRVPFIWLDDVYITCVLRGYLRETINDISKLFMHPFDKDFSNMTNKMVGHLMSKSFEQDYKRVWKEMLNKRKL